MLAQANRLWLAGHMNKTSKSDSASRAADALDLNKNLGNTSEAPSQSGDALPTGLEMDAVTLRVGDLDAMTDYYTESMKLRPIEEKVVGREVRRVLGRGTTPLLQLVHTPNLPGVNPQDAGLYHTAFLFENASDLAAAVFHSARTEGSRFVGSSDHLVSEAFYFTDPEGNGIELYKDRPRSEWDHSADGQIAMETLYLDPNLYLSQNLTEDGLNLTAARPAKVGHVHLQVGDVERARKFYVDALGFEPTAWNYPGALFASAGGYHHHVAMNTWQSAGAGPRAARLGLGDVAIAVPERVDLDMLVERLKRARIPFADLEDAVVVRDPWGTQVTVALPGASPERTLTR